MGTVRLGPSETVHLPSLCVETGRPTTVHIDTEAWDVPARSGTVLLLLGLGAWLVYQALGTTSVPVRLPISGAAIHRHRRTRAVTWAGSAAGVVLLVLATVLGPVAAVAGAAVLVLALAGGSVAATATWVGLHFDSRAGVVVVRRCHPDFVAAVERRRLSVAEPLRTEARAVARLAGGLR